tara:strand:- start:775 stop:2994 length:2220 start_codon:yes stop_codon:yes gene_type:complete
MASQVSPGVVLRERDLTNAVITGASSLTAAFSSTFQKGPIGEIVSISNQKELIDVFGTPKDANAEDWLVASEFLGYGGRLAVVRAGTGVLNATNGAGTLISNNSEWNAGVGAANIFAARSAGTWGNSLKVVAVDRGADQILTLASAPATTTINTAFTTTAGRQGRIYSWDAATKELAVILDDPSTIISSGDKFDEPGDGVAQTVTAGAYAGQGTQNGTHTVDPTGGTGSGLRLNVVIDANGDVTGVTIVNGGTGYSANDSVTVAAAGLGTGAVNDLTVTVNTVSDDNINVDSVKDWYTNTTIGTTGLKLSAIGPRPGTSEFASSRGISYDEIHVAVIDTTGDVSGAANTVLERFTYLSKLSDGKSSEGSSIYFKEIVNLDSSFIFHGADLGNTIEPTQGGGGVAFGSGSTGLASGSKFLLVASNETDLGNGTDDYAYTAGEVTAGYDLFLDTEETEVDFVLMGGSLGTETDTIAKAQKVVAIAAARKDCIAFVSPFTGNQIGSGGSALTPVQQRTNTLNFFNNITSTSYAVLDSGYKYMYDRFNDKYRYIATNGDIAGLCVSTSSAIADWISPAGMARGGLRNVIKLAYNPNKADRDELYQNRINPVVTFPGSGPVLFGDKTALASPSAFDRINVRRLFLNIEKRVEGLAKSVLFEINDETTRSSFLANINGYLNEISAQQGITDFLVVCDGTNNTADVVDRNEFVAELFIKPARSINYVTVTFTATRTGVSFSEVVGR